MSRLLSSALAPLLVFAWALPAGAAVDPLRDKQWGLTKVGAPEAWATATGAGVVIAVVDSGVDLQHEDLKGRIVAGKDYVDGDDVAQDAEGHGTHVAGIAAAIGDNGRGVAGVAPGAKIMPVRVLDENGSAVCAGNCGDDPISAGIRWAADHGAKVVNLSLGDLGAEAMGDVSFAEAIQYAWDKGAIPVVAAGNSYVFSSAYDSQPALVVAATTRDDRKPTYSDSIGNAKWGIAAPGGQGGLTSSENDILSTYWVSGRQNQYAYLAGTSMAAPHVSGAAAVLLSMGLNKDQVVQTLLQTADPIGDKQTFGAGRLNLAKAVASAKQPGPAGAPATPAPSSSGNRQTRAAQPGSKSSSGDAPTAPPAGGQAPVASAPPAEATDDAPQASARSLAAPETRAGRSSGGVGRLALAAGIVAAGAAGLLVVRRVGRG